MRTQAESSAIRGESETPAPKPNPRQRRRGTIPLFLAGSNQNEAADISINPMTKTCLFPTPFATLPKPILPRVASRDDSESIGTRAVDIPTQWHGGQCHHYISQIRTRKPCPNIPELPGKTASTRENDLRPVQAEPLPFSRYRGVSLPTERYTPQKLGG